MKQQIKRVLRAGRSFYLSIGSNVKCSICGWTGHSFMRVAYKFKPEDSFICPSCGSSERHRFAYFTMKDTLAKYADKTLHFAPERCIEPWLRSISKEYLSVDLMSASAMENMDITNLRLEDNSFSLVWCSHVLEHVEDDYKAMSELFRVLRPSGVAVIMVPIESATTYENPEVRTPAERLKHFKQEDHVRLYGLDIEDRLRDSGFKVEVLQVSDISIDSVKFQALEYPSTKEIFICTKPHQSNKVIYN
jgi:predicted SAM-dependent methyltransferase